MNNTLYEITDKYLKVLDNLEIDEETGEILNAEELDELSGAFEEKSEAVACYIKNSEVFIGNLKAEEANLAKRRKQTEKRIDYLKNILHLSIQKMPLLNLPWLHNYSNFRCPPLDILNILFPPIAMFVPALLSVIDTAAANIAFT